jgi:hypothetical protein
MKVIPHSIIDLLPIQAGLPLVTPQSITLPFVKGFKARVYASALNPSNGVYDFSPLDTILQPIWDAGKFTVISVYFGIYVPTHWFSTNGGTVLPVTTSSGTQGCPWQPEYQTHMDDFITARAAHYEPNPLVTGVCMTGIGINEQYQLSQNTFDDNTWTNQANLYSKPDRSTAARQAFGIIGGYWQDSFPTTNLYFIADTAVPLWKDPVTGIQAVVDAMDDGDSFWGDRFGESTDVFRAQQPPGSPVVPLTRPSLAQAISASNNHNLFYNPPLGDSQPLPPQPALDISNTAFVTRYCSLALYEYDINNSVNWPGLTENGDLICSNTPGGCPADPVEDPPQITSVLDVSWFTGKNFFYQITADQVIDSYSAVGLPAALTLNPVTGLITGQIAAPGTYTITLGVTNDNGSDFEDLSLTVTLKNKGGGGGGGGGEPPPPPDGTPGTGPLPFDYVEHTPYSEATLPVCPDFPASILPPSKPLNLLVTTPGTPGSGQASASWTPPLRQ